MKLHNFLLGGILIVITLVFKNWIFADVLSSGDFGFYSTQHIKGITFLSIWDTTWLGMGANVLSSLWLNAYSTSTVKLALFLGWNTYAKLFWYFPYIIFSFLSSMLLCKFVCKVKYVGYLAALLYAVNTYSLMIVGGGQMGVALAYAIAPFVLLVFIKIVEYCFIKTLTLKALIGNMLLPINVGLLFALLVMFDLRLAYIVMVAVIIYFIIVSISQFWNIKSFFLSLFVIFVLPLSITALLHAFWLIPAVSAGRSTLDQLGDVYTTSSAVTFFSFATLENSLALLHPNWPDNIFGKVGFMKAEFLILPILAYVSLFFVNKSVKNKEQAIERCRILFFIVLGLIGSFLAKGANEPFGDMYIWMFEHIPGFVMFRDPTKWYLLIALSYSVLVPFSVWKIVEWLGSQQKISLIKNNYHVLQIIFSLVIILYILFLIRPAVLGQLHGTLRHTEIPEEYARLENYLASQPQFFRTFWLPTTQRFGFYSSLHPAISAKDYLRTSNITKLVDNFNDDSTKQLLSEASVKYVIIPYDSQGELFIKDRKYAPQEYEKTIKAMRKISWLKEVEGFGKIIVFEVPNVRDHFWSEKAGLVKQYTYISPTKYILHIENARNNDKIVFSEQYDPMWVMKKIDTHQDIVHSEKYKNRFNSFILPENGSYQVEISYKPQQYVTIGLWISGITGLLIVSSYLVLFIHRKIK